MGTLTTNLHLLMGSFYTPTKEKNKIILDWKAFPSDHYAIESQIRGHGYDPKEAMIMIAPEDGQYEVSTESILRVIDEHADTTALVLLPGIQYYTGQLFEMKTITAYAQSKGLIVGWDLAHAAGNVPLELHDWNVDFAVWCTYKYMNAGPGAIAGLYVHERHGVVDYSDGEDQPPKFRHRLAGWYGGDQVGRFNMDNSKFTRSGVSRDADIAFRVQTKSRSKRLSGIESLCGRSGITLRLAFHIQPDKYVRYSEKIRPLNSIPRASPISWYKFQQGVPNHNTI